MHLLNILVSISGSEDRESFKRTYSKLTNTIDFSVLPYFFARSLFFFVRINVEVSERMKRPVTNKEKAKKLARI